MTQIIVPRRRIWSRQPATLTPVDRTHWAGRFCDLAYNGATNADHANLVLGSTSPSKIVRKEGLGPNTTSAGITLGPARGFPAKPFTLMVQAQAIAWGGAGADWIFQGYGGVAGCSFGVSAGGSLRLTFFGVADYSVGPSLYDESLPVKNYAVVVNGSTAVFYINGVYYNQATVGTPVASTSYAPTVQKAAAHPSSILPFAFRFGMAMSQGQIASLVDEPWQIFARRDRRTVIDFVASGTTAVYADSALAYYIRSMLSSDSGIQYAIRNAIFKDDAVGYYLRSAISQNSEVGYVLRQAIAKDDAEAYKIRGLVQSSDAETYSIRGLVQSSDAETYSIRGLVQTLDGEAYKIRSQVQADASASYDIQSSTSVASSNAVNYSVRGVVSASSLVGYSVRGSVQKDAASAYSVRSAASRDVVASYAVSASASSVYADSTASYLVDGVVPSGPSAESIAAAVVSALQSTTIPVDIASVKGDTSITPWPANSLTLHQYLALK